MKMVTISPLMGKIEIPKKMRLVRNGVTKPGDQVIKSESLRKDRPFSYVYVGGIPVIRYCAVIRPTKGAKKVWNGLRKMDRPDPKKKVKRLR